MKVPGIYFHGCIPGRCLHLSISNFAKYFHQEETILTATFTTAISIVIERYFVLYLAIE